MIYHIYKLFPLKQRKNVFFLYKRRRWWWWWWRPIYKSTYSACRENKPLWLVGRILFILYANTIKNCVRCLETALLPFLNDFREKTKQKNRNAKRAWKKASKRLHTRFLSVKFETIVFSSCVFVLWKRQQICTFSTLIEWREWKECAVIQINWSWNYILKWKKRIFFFF